MRRLVSILCLLAATCLFTIGCGVKLFPDVHFAFKTTGGAGGYNENITEFVVGKRFYTAITVWLTTDTSWRSPEYRVVIEVPRTKEVEVEEHGGLGYDSKEWDFYNQLTRLTYNMKGNEKALREKILFHGTPIGEGQATMKVKIYNKEGQLLHWYYKNIYFKYDITE